MSSTSRAPTWTSWLWALENMSSSSWLFSPQTLRLFGNNAQILITKMLRCDEQYVRVESISASGRKGKGRGTVARRFTEPMRLLSGNSPA
jgi:hypothetical protein